MNSLAAKEWLKIANDDLQAAKELMDIEHLTHISAFHSQQAVEKSLKAILEYNNRKVPKKHDLLQLKNLVLDELVVDQDDLLEDLNTLYIESRYPGDFGLLPNGKPTVAQAKEFYEFANNIYIDTKKQIV